VIEGEDGVGVCWEIEGSGSVNETGEVDVVLEESVFEDESVGLLKVG